MLLISPNYDSFDDKNEIEKEMANFQIAREEVKSQADMNRI